MHQLAPGTFLKRNAKINQCLSEHEAQRLSFFSGKSLRLSHSFRDHRLESSHGSRNPTPTPGENDLLFTTDHVAAFNASDKSREAVRDLLI